MRHHYWKGIIATYLFLGGLGGGIFCLAAILSFFVYPDMEVVQQIMAWPAFLALLCLGVGCIFLVADLGQPLVFYRAMIKSTSVICWGARVLTICLFAGLFWFVSFVPWEWFKPIADFFVPMRLFWLAIAGISGTCIMLYTGIFFSTLKAHAFWATPALPILFTVSALSTACACICLSAGFWPAEPTVLMTAYGPIDYTAIATHATKEVLHMLDIILIVIEVVILLVMTLSFIGAGNNTAKRAAKRWVCGSWAPIFWCGMMAGGLVIPEILYIAGGATAASEIVAPVLVLAGGLLLRFLITFSDDRAPLPGENRYYSRLVGNDALFIHRWVYGENEY